MINTAEIIAKKLGIKVAQARATIKLFEDGNTVPFIARYRKEVTGGLTDEQVHNLHIQYKRQVALAERRTTIKAAIAEQGKLSENLEKALDAAKTLTELEDLYAPYKKKRETRGALARKAGLGGLAMQILRQPVTDQTLNEIAEPFLSAKAPTLGHAWQGARDIVAEAISDNARVRQAFRRRMMQYGTITCTKKEDAEDEGGVYQTYYNFDVKVDSLRPHQILAINRGEKEGILSVKVDIPEYDKMLCLRQISRPKPESILHDQLVKATDDGTKRLLMPAVQRDIRRELTEKAEDHAIQVFAKNLDGLLSQPPLGGHRILAIDPGFRTGCKLAVIDETGRVHETGQFYLRRKDDAIKRMMMSIDRHDVTLVAIGNGTGCREAEKLVSQLNNLMPDDKAVQFLVVNEAGASVYSASEVARQELPELDVTLRGAVSIGRRVQDPLAELVKIDPQSIGVGLYQHDVNQKKLGESLDGVVELVVNRVGVDLNTASPALLTHVAGIGAKTAEKIVAFRDENGAFPNRSRLQKVSGVGKKTYEQCVGFLRVHNSDNAFDTTAIHPESYGVARKVMEKAGISLEDSTAEERETALANLPKVKELAAEMNVGEMTLTDILDQLARPGRDPREDFDKPILRSDVMSVDDLKKGLVLQGTVRNVVDFGAFIDIGVKRDGLLPRKLLLKRDTLSVGQIVDVEIREIDQKRGRISLKWPKK